MNSRAKFLTILVLFLAPLVAAVVLFFFFPQWVPTGRLNYGTLVNPARPVPALALVDEAGQPSPLALREKWSFVFVAGQACDGACRARLVLIRQVRLAMGEKGVRVRYVYVAPDAGALAAAREALLKDHPSMLFVADAGSAGARAPDFFHPTDPDALYLVDPAGNWLMTYSGSLDPKGVLADLKKLLRYSHIG